MYDIKLQNDITELKGLLKHLTYQDALELREALLFAVEQDNRRNQESTASPPPGVAIADL